MIEGFAVKRKERKLCKSKSPFARHADSVVIRGIGRRGRDENHCMGSGLSKHFISRVQDVGRDCRPPREHTAHRKR